MYSFKQRFQITLSLIAFRIIGVIFDTVWLIIQILIAIPMMVSSKFFTKSALKLRKTTRTF